ncbi:vegetative cell wall protein gp1-like [Solanum stenotomum]|uniref:vegetative cell wall protein gp1-like n=1 Tax=Solanum stenotomum TaxID=172797 RepID=UPI0020D00BCC|nr:vegetative cell wall protein gp1-like [Solanum stenotomum]
MASQQPPRPLFRFASMVRPAAQPAQPPPASAPPAPSPQPMFRPTTPFRPASPAVTAPQPPQPPVPTAPPVAVVTAPPQPQVSVPGSPISPRRRQPVATSPPRSPVAPPQSVVSPPKAPSPRSPVAAQPQRAATEVPKSPVIRTSPVIRATTSVPQSPFKPLASNVTTENAPTRTPYSSFPPSPKTKLPDSIQTLINQSSPSKAPPPSQNVFQPNLVKSQTYSPQTKPAVSHPPSPLKLPPSQLELESKIPSHVDQKSVVVHETMRANANGHHVLQTARNGNTVESWKQETVKKDKGVQKKKVSNSDAADDFGTSVLTLAGDNKGAIMELSPSRKTYSPQSLQKKGSPKSWSSEDDGEKSGNESGRKGDKMQNKSLPMTAFMNSNVQGINNSILHNASCTHHDPGVHLVFSRKTNGSNGLHIKGSQKS